VLCCQHSGALYETDKLSGRYSVNVAIGEPQAGATFTTILYALGCKSSCDSGINRRSTSIIFTLEKK
jgi:P53 DNA-binding domain